MAGESVEQLLRQLTLQTGEGAAQVYAKYASLTIGDDDSLFRLVSRKLTANAKPSQIKESLESTLRAGGAVGESVEEMLLSTGLTGWT